MALLITRNNNIFEVEGNLNNTTSSYFIAHLSLSLNSSNGLSIDINKVKEIDSNGIKALEEIFNKAKSWDKPFYIIGENSEKVYDQFKYNNVA